MTELEGFLGVQLKDLPKAEHASTAQRVDEGPHDCVMCYEEAVGAFHAAWPPPLEQHGYWIDLCAEHGSALRRFADEQNMNRGL